MGRAVKKEHDFLKAKYLLAVLFETICGFQVMKEKINVVLNSNHFLKINGSKEENVVKNGKTDK